LAAAKTAIFSFWKCDNSNTIWNAYWRKLAIS
jgi:hypothetical protein